MTRKEWQRKSSEHIKSARVLLAAKQFSIAYHVAGLAVECALKARIARQFKKDTWPELGYEKKIFSHILTDLVKHADLQVALNAQETASPVFKQSWSNVKDWRVESRYKNWSEAEAVDMVRAAGHPRNGVLAWIKLHW